MSRGAYDSQVGQNILVPPRVYLDLNHVIEICRMRAGASPASARREAYAAISAACGTGLCTVLFNPGVFLEMADRANARELCEEVASFFESCVSVLEVETLHAYLFELVEEVRRCAPGVPLPEVPVVRSIGDMWGNYQALLQHHPEYPKNFGPKVAVTIRTWMEHALEMAYSRPDMLRSRIAGWRHAVQVSSSLLGEVSKNEIPQDAKVYWACQALGLDQVLKSASPNLKLEQILLKADFDRCKSTRIYLRALWHYTRALAGRPASDNDADDWIYVPAVAYADFALIERGMCHHIVSANPELVKRVLRAPEDLASALVLAA